MTEGQYWYWHVGRQLYRAGPAGLAVRCIALQWFKQRRRLKGPLAAAPRYQTLTNHGLHCTLTSGALRPLTLSSH